MNEEWRDIAGYEGLYQVSSEGNVKSLERIVERSDGKQRLIKERIMKPVKNRGGYLQILLSKDGKVKHAYVHRLVSQAFIPNPSNLPEINHIDENPSNNNVENLEWCDRAYNNSYGTHHQRMAATLKKNGVYERCAELCKQRWSKPVFQFTVSGEFVAKYESASEAARQLNYHKDNISRCCTGEYKQAYGFKWSYEPLHQNKQPIQLTLNFL